MDHAAAAGAGLALDEADALLAALETGAPSSALPPLPDPLPDAPLSTSEAAADAANRPGAAAALSKRERERRELLFLRSHSTTLALQLEKLRVSIACGRRLGARQSIWRHIARRHLADRRRAERENARLRGELSRHVRFARELQLKAADSSDGERKGDAKERHPPYTLEDRDRTVLAQLVSELDLAYGLIDAVFPEREDAAPADAVGAVGSSYYSIRKTQLLETESGSPTGSPGPAGAGAEPAWVELRDARVIPFDCQLVIDAVWRSWVVWHLGSSNLHSGAWSSSRRYHGVDRPEHTLALKFRLRSLKPNQSPTFLHEKVTVRRYLERDRLVLVWRCTSEGEQEFAGLSTDETEWVVVERAGLRGPGGGPEYAVIRSCVRLIPTRAGVGAQASTRDSRTFTNLVIRSYEDDANFALREMESMLLRATASSS